MKKFCEKHGEYESEIVKIMGVTFEQSCPICAKEAEEKEAQEEAERKRRSIIANNMLRGVEEEFIGKTLEDFIPETESEHQALNAAKDLSAGFIKKLIMIGDNGVGKTLLADALVQKHDGIRITMFELSCKIRSAFNSGLNEIDILDGLLKRPLIVIDEIGRTKGSDAERNWMSYLVDKAHARGIKLMLISNRKMARSLPKEQRGEAFEFYVDNDVISRLRQNSRIVEVKGRDRRTALAAL